MALTTNLLRRRPHIRPSLHRSFSSSSDNPSNDDVSSQRNSSFSSYFSDVKASLSKQAPPSQPYMKRPFSPSSNPNPPPKISSLGEIRKSLSEFRRVSAPPPPSPSSHISFQELYKRNVVPKSGEGARKVDQFDAIRESLSNLKSKNEGTIGSRRLNGLTSNPFSLSLKGNIDPKTLMGEGGQSLPLHIFGKEVGGKDGKVVGEGLGGVADKFVRSYNYEDLGKKLMNLRPEKKRDERNWFSLQELSERLHKLRVNDEKEMETGLKGYYKDIRATLMQTDKSDKERRTNANVLRLDMLNNLGAEQDFMLSPPKEHLVEKYFHPDNMSSAEKLKIELKNVRDEFKMSESDCGSARVQVAQLTTKIKHLSTALHKKDKHSRKGLQAMVQRRKKLLKYLRRTDWDSYCLVLSKLGLRDNPDYKN